MIWTDIFMVPLVMACALGGTVVLVKLITRFNNRGNKNSDEEMRK